MTYGVTINGTDTKTQYGLILLADLTVENPPPVINMVSVPGRSGAYDFTELLGNVIYGQRTISFTLFKRVGDLELKATRDALAEAYNGQRVQLTLPDDTGHYYKGRMTVGGISGYNTGRIPITMIADPDVNVIGEADD